MRYENYFNQLKVAIPILMAAQNVPALSISVTSKNDRLFSEGFGYTDLSNHYKVTANTRFSIQSISKTYTAFGFMLAIDSGKVKLDDSLTKYVPSFCVKSRDGYDYSDKITFRHLLKHRSGLAHEAPTGNNYTYGAFEEHIRSINETYLRFKPDESYSYSNLGIDLVAYTLQKLYNMSFEEYMQQYVFTPLEMGISTYKQEKFLSDIKSAVGHSKTALKKEPVPMLGAGGMYSCAEDMANFVQCFLNDGMYKKRQIINQNTLKLMYKEYPASENWKYNLGMDVGTFQGEIIANHNGGGYGFYCTQDILPYYGLGAVSLTNSVMHSNIQHGIIRSIWSDIFTLAHKNESDCKRLPDECHDYIGVYQARCNECDDRKVIIPRNGAIYLGDQKLSRYEEKIYFTENNDIVQFVDDNSVKINYILYKRVV